MKVKKLKFTIPPPQGNGECEVMCPLFVYTCAVTGLSRAESRHCGAGLGVLRLGGLFPSEGCPQWEESKRCHG